MVDVVPFKGLLYNEEKSGPYPKLTAPPYDVIRPDMQEDLYAKNPYNIVRLILGKQFPDDDDSNNRYTRSAKDFSDWVNDSVLKEDESPAFYAYSQEYSFNGITTNRMGFFARVKLEDFSKGNICPHEFTLAKAKKDRTFLLKACKANFSPIFGLFSDPSGAVDDKLASVTQSAPLAVIEEDSVTHRFWRVDDEETIQFLSSSLSDKKVYIADGHHRYETALGYHKENGDKVKDSAHVMMFLTNLDSQGLAIYPIHRLLKPPSFNREEFLIKLHKFFVVEPFPENASAEELVSLLEEAGKKQISFCAYMGQGSALLLKLRDTKNVLPFLADDEPPEMQVLDVSQLHVLVLKNILGVDTRKPEGQQHLSYNVRTQETMDMVDEGKFDLAFFMNPTKIDHVRNLAEKGVRLPQKATYFYPKLLSGLVINKFSP